MNNIPTTTVLEYIAGWLETSEKDDLNSIRNALENAIISLDDPVDGILKHVNISGFPLLESLETHELPLQVIKNIENGLLEGGIVRLIKNEAEQKVISIKYEETTTILSWSSSKPDTINTITLDSKEMSFLAK